MGSRWQLIGGFVSGIGLPCAVLPFYSAEKKDEGWKRKRKTYSRLVDMTSGWTCLLASEFGNLRYYKLLRTTFSSLI